VFIDYTDVAKKADSYDYPHQMVNHFLFSVHEASAQRNAELVLGGIKERQHSHRLLLKVW